MGFHISRRTLVVLLVLAAFFIALFFFLGETEQVPDEPVLQDDTVLSRSIIGTSVQGRAIEAYVSQTAKTGSASTTHLVFVGGVHGGYEWNSVLLAYQFIDHLEANPASIPEGMKVTVIPNANPDAVFKAVGKEGRFAAADVSAEATATARFNANGVDLNRNFDCKWKPQSTWRGNVVSAGSKPFSEPEARAIRDYVLKNRPDAVIFWHSQANAVYASECTAGILSGTRQIMNAYAQASGYQAVDAFDAYEITGDAEGWLASIGIPAITVELSSHEVIEWDKNLAGIKALFSTFTAK